MAVGVFVSDVVEVMIDWGKGGGGWVNFVFYSLMKVVIIMIFSA